MHLPATQGVMARLQGQILELQGELKEFKTRNKQLHQKLILAEAMMEGRPAPEPTLLNGEHQEKRLSGTRRPRRAARSGHLIVECGFHECRD